MAARPLDSTGPMQSVEKIFAPDDRGKRLLWALAWLCFLMAIPTRLYFFSGYGLGDDHIFVAPLIRFLETGQLDFADFRLTRPLVVIPQLIAFSLLAVDDFSFVLPILFFALATHALSLFFVRELMGERAALFVSLFFLTCPFETLVSTAFSPDSILVFYSVACVWSCYRAYRLDRHGAMIAGGLLLVCCIFTKFSAVLMIPVLALATLLGWRRWKGWLFFWSSFALGTLAMSLLFWALAGHPLQWVVHRAYPAWGHDVTHMLGTVLSKYPRYLFWTDPDHGGWMFGLTGFAAFGGMLLAAYTILLRRRPDHQSVLVFLFLVYVLLFNFAPHKIDVSAYYSHPRIFRYLAQISAFIYIAAAFLGERLWLRGKTGRVLATVTLLASWGFGISQIPIVTEPSWDPNADGRELSRFFREHPPEGPTTISADQWNCERLQYMSSPRSRNWRLNCSGSSSAQEKKEFLRAIDHGYVVTGGGSLDWYSHHPWVLNLVELGFDPPAQWRLLLRREAPVRRWRSEPLRIWQVADTLAETDVTIRDGSFDQCLRARVQPLRPQDGLPADRPITRRLARFVTKIECQDSGISDVTGLEEFVNLDILNLAGNDLTVVDVSALTKLDILILGLNRIASVKGIRQLKDLRLLWLGYNRLESVDVSGLAKLEDLRLDRNRLVRLEGAADLVRLRSLFLGGNPDLDCGSLGFPEALIGASGCGD